MMPPVPVEWQSHIPAATLARIIAGVRSHIGTSITEADVERRRESEGADMEDDQ